VSGYVGGRRPPVRLPYAMRYVFVGFAPVLSNASTFNVPVSRSSRRRTAPPSRSPTRNPAPPRRPRARGRPAGRESDATANSSSRCPRLSKSMRTFACRRVTNRKPSPLALCAWGCLHVVTTWRQQQDREHVAHRCSYRPTARGRSWSRAGVRVEFIALPPRRACGGAPPPPAAPPARRRARPRTRPAQRHPAPTLRVRSGSCP
jgi:hypothetical protein